MSLILETSTKPVPINQKLKRGKGKRLYISKEFRQTWATIDQEFYVQRLRKSNMVSFENPFVEIFIGWKEFDQDACLKQIFDSLQKLKVASNDKKIRNYNVREIGEEKLIIKISEWNGGQDGRD